MKQHRLIMKTFMLLLFTLFNTSAYPSISLKEERLIKEIRSAMDLLNAGNEIEGLKKIKQIRVNAKRIKSSTVYAMTYYFFCAKNVYRGDFKTALKYNDSMYNGCLQNNYKIGISKAYTTYADLYSGLGDYSLALKYSLEKVKICKEIKDPQGVGEGYQAIGIVYSSLKEHKLSKKYFLHSIQYFNGIKLKNYSNLIFSYINLDHECNELKEDLNSFYYSKKAFDLTNKFNENAYKIQATSNYCSHLMNRKKFELVERLLLPLVDNHQIPNFERDRVYLYITLSQLYHKLNDLNKAEFYAKASLDAANESDWLYFQIESLENLVFINKQQKEYQSMALNLEKLNKLKLEQANSDKAKDLEIMLVKYQLNSKIKFEKLDKKRKILRLKNENLKNESRTKTAIIISLTVFIIIVILYFRERIRKKKEQLFKVKANQKLLLSQLNPHFIFNVLALLRMYLFLNNSQKTTTILENFSKVIRTSLLNSRNEKATLEAEIQFITTYLDLQLELMNDNFRYEINIDLDKLGNIEMPSMTLINFVENIFKHNSINEKSELMIEINAHVDKEQKQVAFHIINRCKKGCEPTEIESFHSTYIIEERLKLYFSKFKTKSFIKMNPINYENALKGFHTEIIIPIQHDM